MKPIIIVAALAAALSVQAQEAAKKLGIVVVE